MTTGTVLGHSPSSRIHHKRGVMGFTDKWCFDGESCHRDIAALGRRGPWSPWLDAASRVSTEGLFIMFYLLFHTSYTKTGDHKCLYIQRVLLDVGILKSTGRSADRRRCAKRSIVTFTCDGIPPECRCS